MRGLFEGKRKLIIISLLGILSLIFLPIAIGLGAGWLVYKKVGSPKLKYSLLTVIAFFIIFTGTAWVLAMTSPNKPESKQEQTSQTPPSPEAETTATETTQEPSPLSSSSKSEQKQEQTAQATPISEAQTAITEKTKEPSSTQESTILANMQTAKVARVIDGDTIDVSFDGKTERIRIIGINTPETVDPRKPVECFGQEASAVAKDKLTDKTVQLESDPTQEERDKYDRLLKYVWMDNGTVDFGKLMIATGYAYEYTYNIPYKYQTEYKQAQKEAEQGKKGLWADDACVQPTTAPTQSSGTQTSRGGSCKYSCTSPDRDCADFSTHAEAVAFFNCCGFTATNDPMRLDSIGVGDGDPCESLP